MEIPDILKKKENLVEGNVIACLWNKPDLYDTYENIENSFYTPSGKFYYALGKEMYFNDIKTFDEVSVVTFLLNKKAYAELFEANGGYKSIKQIMNIVKIENDEYYFSELKKINMLKQLALNGFDVAPMLDKFESLKSEDDILNYFEWKLNNISLEAGNSLNLQDLNITDEEIDTMENGGLVGIQYGKHMPILNHETLGLPTNGLYMLTSYTGMGKSSMLMACYVIPIAETKTKVALIANEAEVDFYKTLLLEYVLTQRLNYYKLPRHKLKKGNWTLEDKNAIQKAREIIKIDYAPYIIFEKMHNYDMEHIKTLAKKLSQQNYKALFVDTFKADLETESAWVELKKASTNLYQIASKYNLAIMCTVQLALHSKDKQRLINETVLSNSKGMTEVFFECVGFRDIMPDEYSGCENDIMPFRLKKDGNGTYQKQYINISRDDGKTYRIVFLFKTKNSRTGLALLYHNKGEYNEWFELGYCTVKGKNLY